jgi:hypothetical protein
MWLAQMRHLLSGSAIRKLLRHTWSIVSPCRGEEWFTSDHPAMRLNFTSPTQYDFGGGWGRHGSDLFLPLTPQHLLYTRVGYKQRQRFAFSEVHTHLMQRLLAERAHRWIFAKRESAAVSHYRPRIADADRAKHEDAEWARWDEMNRA